MSDSGYANLFYLVPERRGTGFGPVLQQYAARFFQKRDLERASLSVSPSNLRAIAYYQKHGWRRIGPDPRRDGVDTMELDLRPRAQPK